MMTVDDLMSAHTVTVNVVATMTDTMASLDHGEPADGTALAACLTDLANAVRDVAVVQRDLLAAAIQGLAP